MVLVRGDQPVVTPTGSEGRLSLLAEDDFGLSVV